MSGTADAEPEGVVSKVKVKKQIKTIVEDLENVLGDLKDVAKELKEVVHEIDSLTCDLPLEEEMTDSSKTDTLNSSSSSTTTTTTASSVEKIKYYPDDTAIGSSIERMRFYPDDMAISSSIEKLRFYPDDSTIKSYLERSKFYRDDTAITSYSERSKFYTNTTGSCLEKIKFYTDDTFLRPTTILTVTKKTHPPLPPPRLTPLRSEDHMRSLLPVKPLRSNGTLMRNGVFPGKPASLQNLDSCCAAKNFVGERALVPVSLLRHEKSRCHPAASSAPGGPTRERVRFSEKVQYHGYCPDCDLRYDADHGDAHLHSETTEGAPSPAHRCSAPSPSPPPATLALENGGGGLSSSHSFPPVTAPCTPHHPTLKPQKTILRKSTTTTV
ncbi:protein Largen [Denticeps clupeoides]|uniref:Uncharacterized protein n=1 Tax=Denticeps clupeoides TaxID=299321 RepID=A0AAY4D407_9TELE|nr:protein Largen [Denticeps clupeoides]